MKNVGQTFFGYLCKTYNLEKLLCKKFTRNSSLAAVCCLIDCINRNSVSLYKKTVGKFWKWCEFDEILEWWPTTQKDPYSNHPRGHNHSASLEKIAQGHQTGCVFFFFSDRSWMCSFSNHSHCTHGLLKKYSKLSFLSPVKNDLLALKPK